ncbi:ribonuclease H protein [Canna indica]|uniref:Ribonuclease H protein n=1 Tax=Canna indica TaxID=4628 RepID=A0AAQ3JWV4_9LILI|nr:ribonuclease H protein [Canna indica]
MDRTEKWDSRFTSQAGKVVLLNSVMNSIPIHTLATSWINDKVLKSYKSMAKRFLWSSSKDKKGIHLVSWEKITLSKYNGGLGVKDLSIIKYSIHARRALDFLNKKDMIWTRLPSESSNKTSAVQSSTVSPGNVKNDLRSRNDVGRLQENSNITFISCDAAWKEETRRAGLGFHLHVMEIRLFSMVSVQGFFEAPWYIADLISDIRTVADEVNVIDWIHIKRNFNQ